MASLAIADPAAGEVGLVVDDVARACAAVILSGNCMQWDSVQLAWACKFSTAQEGLGSWGHGSEMVMLWNGTR